LGPRPVLQMHTDARILIAGQAPGRRVHESGVPFDDPSGDRLREWLGVDRATFYDPRHFAILPMGFCYPGTGRGGDLPPRSECAPAWRAPLLAGLRDLRLTLVIGRYAQAYHLPQAAGGVTEVVRAWRSFLPDHLPLPHPSPRNQMWVSRNPWFVKDVLPELRSRVRHVLAGARGQSGA
jgi:uracil-DNA glycosylase